MQAAQTIDIFCHVIDNFGDAGVCWRLAQQLANQVTYDCAMRVTLWIDALDSLHKICHRLDPSKTEQHLENVVVKQWREDALSQAAAADVVIEAFGCTLPPSYLNAMAARVARPSIWINLEYLSAETWVEDCHRMVSVHPTLPLKKYFFFPGFTDKTGGVLGARYTLAQREELQNDPQRIAEFFTRLGVPYREGMRTVSLFCYPTAPVDALLAAMQQDERPTLCLIPQGIADDVVAEVMAEIERRPSKKLSPSHSSLSHSSLPNFSLPHFSLHILPFLDQADYDKLLCACDLNFVRGEDSFVQAQWAGRPFIWHIYPQNEQAHWVKLHAFLDRYTAGMPADLRKSLIDIWQTWNGAAQHDNEFSAQWAAFNKYVPLLQSHIKRWEQQLQQHGDLAGNLLRMIQEIG